MFNFLRNCFRRSAQNQGLGNPVYKVIADDRFWPRRQSNETIQNYMKSLQQNFSKAQIWLTLPRYEERLRLEIYLGHQGLDITAHNREGKKIYAQSIDFAPFRSESGDDEGVRQKILHDLPRQFLSIGIQFKNPKPARQAFENIADTWSEEAIGYGANIKAFEEPRVPRHV